MAEIFSTLGLIIDVTAVLTLILLSHAESGMARIVGTDEGILRGLALRFQSMMKCNKRLFALNVVCVVGPVCWNGVVDTRDLVRGLVSETVHMADGGQAAGACRGRVVQAGQPHKLGGRRRDCRQQNRHNRRGPRHAEGRSSVDRDVHLAPR